MTTMPDGYKGPILVDISEIDDRLYPACEMRIRLDEHAVEEYAEILDKLSPVLLISRPDGRHWVVDGAHTITAAKQAKKKTVKAMVKDGPATEVDAWHEASRANADRGVRLEPADKKHRVEAFLELPIAKGMTDRQVADACNVSHQYVSQTRQRINGYLGNSSQSNRLSDPDGLTQAERRVADFYAANPGATVEAAARGTDVSKATVIKGRRKLGMTADRSPRSPGAAPSRPEPASEETGEAEPASNGKPPPEPHTEPEQPPTHEGFNATFPSPQPGSNGHAATASTFDPEGAWTRVEADVIRHFDSWPDEYKVIFKDRYDSLGWRIGYRTPGWKPAVMVEVDRD